MSQAIFNPESWPDDQRQPYHLILWQIVDCYHIYCRGKLYSRYFGKQKSHAEWLPGEHESGYAYEQMEFSGMKPIEQLMFEVLSIVMDGGRNFENKKFMEYSYGKINSILEKHDLQTMLSELPEDERRDFEYDLRLIRVLK